MNYRDLTSEELETQDAFDQHEIVRRIEFSDGLVGFIAVHNTNLGPALGGLRMRAYESEDDALFDVLRLSRGMTYKNAMAGLPLGGGKAVIIGDHRKDKTSDLMREMGRAVESLDGEYVTAEDSGSSEEDMTYIAEETAHVTGLPPTIPEGQTFGELGGNPSPLTALGVFEGMRAAVKHKHGADSLDGMHVAVQGVGAVGLALCRLLAQDGAKLTVTDVSEHSLSEAMAELPALHVVAPEEIYSVEADIFAPCALGAVLNDMSIPQLKARIVAGAANNQLLGPAHGAMLDQAKIVYVPDYVVNAGGVICVGYEYFRKSDYNPMEFEFSRQAMTRHVERIGQTVTELLKRADSENVSPADAADRMAEQRFLEGLPLEEPEDGTPGMSVQ